MKKYFITGFSGFVSRHFLKYISSLDEQFEVLGVDIFQPNFVFNNYENIKCRYANLDLLNRDLIDTYLYQFQPDYVLHLASYSSVGYSWKEPVKSFINNTNIFLNLIEAIRALELDCRILSVGSSEEYGDFNPNQLPLKENNSPNPVSPYAVARVSQEQLSKVYAKSFNMDIIMTRSFNHIGPWQRDIFVIPSFAKQFYYAKKNRLKEFNLTTGNVEIIRDFLDVRDVVAAYDMLFRCGENGEIYNVCSGNGNSLKDIIKILEKITDINCNINISEKLIRPNDIPVIIGSNQKIKNKTGWEQNYSLYDSLKDIIIHFSK